MRLPAFFMVLETPRRELDHCPPGEDIHHGVPEGSCAKPGDVGLLTEGVCTMPRLPPGEGAQGVASLWEV